MVSRRIFFLQAVFGILRHLVLMIFMTVPMLALARVDITPRTPEQTLLWASGQVVFSQDFCVASTGGAQPQSTDVIPYNVTVDAPFAVVNGAAQIAATVQWVDLVTSVTTTLAPATTTADIMTGKLANCPGGDNGRLILTFEESAITSVLPALYQRGFLVTVANAGNGRNSFQATFTVTLDIPDSIRISQLNDINLGMFAGADLSGSDRVCVFRASGLAYGVTITGSGPGGSFSLTDGSSQIPMSVSWSDDAVTAAVSSGVTLGGRANAFTGSDTCNGGSNATLSVLVTEADISANAVNAGGYVGTLTIVVEME